MNESRHPDPATLSLYHDGEGPEELRRSVEEHLADCAECRGRLAKMQAISRALGGLPELKAPESVAAGVRRMTRRPPAPPPRWFSGLAAGVVIAVVLSVAWWFEAFSPEPSTEMAKGPGVESDVPKDGRKGRGGLEAEPRPGEAPGSELTGEWEQRRRMPKPAGRAEEVLAPELAARELEEQVFGAAEVDRGEPLVFLEPRALEKNAESGPGLARPAEVRVIPIVVAGAGASDLEDLRRSLRRALDPAASDPGELAAGARAAAEPARTQPTDRAAVDESVRDETAQRLRENGPLVLELELDASLVPRLEETLAAWRRRRVGALLEERPGPETTSKESEFRETPPTAPVEAAKKQETPGNRDGTSGAAGAEGRGASQETSRVRIRIVLTSETDEGNR